MATRPDGADTISSASEPTGLSRTAHRPTKRLGVALFVLVLVGTLGVALVSIEEAFNERRVALAASDLQFAAMTVENADNLAAYGGQVRLSDLETSIDELGEDHDVALHSLPGQEGERARYLLTQVVEHGPVMLSGDHEPHAVQNHQELTGLLELASSNARHHASIAERSAFLAVLAAVVASATGMWLVIRARLRNQRQRTRDEAEAHAGRRVQSLLNDSPDVLLVIDDSGRITYRSDSAERLLSGDQRTTDDLVALTDPSGRDLLRSHLGQSHLGGVSDVFVLTDRDNQSGWFEIRVSDLTEDDLVEGHVVTVRDITNEMLLRQELERLASTDLLTGLPNRRALQSTLDDASALLQQSEQMMALMIFDIDGFKSVNDTRGHLIGDELLTEVASRMRSALSPDKSLLRLGGDEFALIVPELDSASEARTIADGLLGVLNEPFRLGDQTERVSTSIGITITSDPAHANDLLAEADIAMYEAKRLGGHEVVLYEPTLDATSTAVARMTRALREADYDTEFSVVYQPIVTVDGTRIAGLEGLLRWTSPELGSVPPDEFIPVAESCGEICKIGEWVLNSVCSQLAEWIDLGIDPNISVSFNVSPLQLANQDFISGVLAIARRWSVPPERLVVEITESAALDHTGTAIARLEDLRAAGFQVSVDDFGSGYSNLGQLLHVPFNVIKVDRSLLLTLTAMRELAGGDNGDSCAIMEAIVSIAGVLGAPVICEGVETELQRVSLEASGITYVQGFLTGRPSPPEVITPRLREGELASVPA